MLDINWLNTFVTLAELKHFGKAAAALHMTQPNVSLHIKQLEQNTRVKLIERNPFRLTQAGFRLLDTSKRTLMELQVCQADLNAINDQSRGTLTIAASDIISRLLLIKPFQLFKKAFPGIDFTLLNTTSSQASELVKNAKADLGFVIEQKESQPLYFTELQQIKWCALGNNLQAWQQEQQPENTTHANQPTLILLGHDTRTRDLLDQALPLLKLPRYRVMEVGSVDAQIDWAEAGFGVAIVPEFSLRTKANLTTQVTPLPQFPATRLGYILRQNQVLSKAVKQLLQWVDQEIVDLQH
ncbi:LysR family transcriptional regulator [Rouxiella silvae]|uniref:LysR family transcriptional regulator n=1 Tax=Rouxiella silvae TaxID=1646373 RepID=A0AA41BXY8_9GAMM|nr:LysR family transcriptional regulator [Rouxiella silvae]KQN50344.1 LysR family transcriptional regulator [Serratia sp. Leaf50]MBF6638656.1 LysR family transcriptional regulator [Rouxiella silvae]ORJ22861.1 LysR family transcriptional regulator [Rouxiella silvae]